MLLVKEEIRPAYRKNKKGDIICIGSGIFALEFIPKGTVVYTEGAFSQTFSYKMVLHCFPKVKQDFIYKYATYDKVNTEWHLCTDHAHLWNHDDNANCRYQSEEDLDMVAVRDIQIGEELTCDYREFCDNCKEGNFGFDIL